MDGMNDIEANDGIPTDIVVPFTDNTNNNTNKINNNIRILITPKMLIIIPRRLFNN